MLRCAVHRARRQCLSRLAVAASLALLAVGCASPHRGLPLVTPEQAGRVRAATSADAYRLAPGDRIALTVYGESDLSRTYEVGPDGTIDVPLIGPVQAADLTIQQLSSAVQTRLADGYLNSPAVAGGIVSYRPFYILGEVNKPGEYPYRVGLTLDGAVSLAGGYTYRAQPRFVFIQGEGDAEEQRVQLAPRLVVKPGDTIRVAERLF